MNSHPDLILGLDAGTSVVKAALFDRQGRELAVVRRPTPLYSPQPAWSETSMQATWAMAAEAIRALLAIGSDGKPLEPARIAAVGLTGNMVGAWLIDEQGEPVRDAILWNDGRAQELIDRLSLEHPDFMQAIFRTSGSVMQQGCTLPVLRWLADHEPATLNRAATVLCCKDWIAYKLTGSRQVDPTEASVMPGSAEEARLQRGDDRPLWPPAVAAPLPACTPIASHCRRTGHRRGPGDRPADRHARRGRCRRRARFRYWPGRSRAGCRLHAARHQHPQLPGDGKSNLRAVRCRRHVLPARATLAACDDQRLRHDEHGLVYCPILRRGGSRQPRCPIRPLCPPRGAGANEHSWAPTACFIFPILACRASRAPYWEPAARAEFFGLSDRSTRADLLRALYEGIALSIRDGYAVLPQAVSEIRLSGGGAKSAFWSQIIADCTGCRVVVPPGTEFGARGAALLAGVGVGWYAGVTAAVTETSRVEDPVASPAAVPPSRVFLPRAEMTSVYNHLYSIYRSLQQDLLPAWRLAAGR